MKSYPILFLYFCLFIAGCVFGSIAEYSFNITQLTHYPDVGGFYRFFGWYPAWAPILFGVATVAIVDQNKNLKKFLKDDSSQIEIKGACLSAILFLIAWATISYVPLQTGSTKDLYLWLIALSFWYFVARRSKISLIQGLITSVAGTLFEASLGYFGLYTYNTDNSNFIGLVPSWLFALYFLAGITLGTFSRLIRSR